MSDKLNLDIFWLKDESLEDSTNLRPIPTSSPPNGANGMSDMEGKVTRVGARERGSERVSNCRRPPSSPRSVRRRNGCEATVGLSNRYQCDEVAVRSSEPCQARGNVTEHGNNIVTIYRTSFLD